MEKILEQWYVTQNATTRTALKTVVEKKMFTIIASKSEKGSSLLSKF